MKKTFIIPLLISFLVVSQLRAHEPTFGISPHTIYRGGIGLELEYESARRAYLGTEARVQKLNLETIYGINEDLALTLAVPQVTKTLRSSEQTIRESGVGDILLRTKWRFYRDDQFGAVDQLAIIAGVKLPTGSRSGALALGSGSTDFLVAFAAGRETRLWYYFADARYRLNTANGGDRQGNLFQYDAAFGVRPFQSEYWTPDLVTLVEVNGGWEAKETAHGVVNANSGGHILSVAPGILFSYRNVMLKTALKIPLLQDLNGTQLEDKEEFIVAVELHL